MTPDTGITEEMVEKAVEAYYNAEEAPPNAMRAALEAVAPMILAAGLAAIFNCAQDLSKNE